MMRAGLLSSKNHRRWREWTFLVACWLLVITALWQRRSCQDSWVLEGVVAPVLLFTLAFAFLMAKEMSSGPRAVWAALFVTVLRWIPGLKYEFAYGTSIDQAVHIASIGQLITSGFPPPGTAYTDVPGLHTVLAGLAMLSGSSAEQAAKYGFPLLLGLFPFFVYWFCRQFDMDDGLRGQIVLAAALVFDPYFLLIQGSPFGSLLFFLVMAWFLLREFGPRKLRLPFSIGLVTMIASLLFGHAISSLTAAAVLMSTFLLLPIILALFKSQVRVGVVFGGGQFLALLLLLIGGWWLFQAHELFTTAFEQLEAAAHGGASAKLPVPSRLFDLPTIDRLWTMFLMHGSTIVLLLLSAIGALILWKKRDEISPGFKTSLLVIAAAEISLILILAGQLLIGFGNLEYFRLIGYAVLMSPFFAGLALWQLRLRSRIEWAVVICGFLLISLLQIFPYQPAVSKAERVSSTMEDGEPVLYFHTVMSSFQADMLAFAWLHAPKQSVSASDRITRDTSLRLFGWTSFRNALFNGYADDNNKLDGGDWQLLMVHQPGPAGPFSERVECRTRAEVDRIVREPGFSLVYSNGESFILTRP